MNTVKPTVLVFALTAAGGCGAGDCKVEGTITGQTFVPPGWSVKGSFLPSDSPKPVPAEVVVWRGGLFGDELRAEADDDGRFAITLPKRASWTLSAEYGGLLQDSGLVVTGGEAALLPGGSMEVCELALGEIVLSELRHATDR